MKKNQVWELPISGFVVAVLLLTLLLLPGGHAVASRDDKMTRSSEMAFFFDRRHKILILGVLPGQVVSVYGVDGSDTPVFNNQGVPNGQFAGDYLGPQDGKPLEIYIPLSSLAEGPTARQSRFFLWSADGGWQLLASIAPVQSFPDTYVYVK